MTVEGSLSSWADVTSGIPQGSVLGPLLFVIFINDLPEVVSEGTDIYLFSDDAKLYRKITSTNDCNILQHDLGKLQAWSEQWLLKFHPHKCKVLEIGSKKFNFDYKLGETSLDNTTKEKDIGVTVDHKLCFEYHMQEKINKANSIMGIIRRTFSSLDEVSFKQLYKSMVRPHLEYANPVWSPSLRKNIIALENVQRRATKCVPGLQNKSYSERLKLLDLPTLVYRRLRGDMIETYKITSGLYDKEVGNIFVMYKDVVAREGLRGHNKKIYKFNSMSRVRRSFFTQRVVDLWNNLPHKVVNAPSVKCFERRLDNHWRRQEILYDFEALIKTTSDHNNEENYEANKDLDTED